MRFERFTVCGITGSCPEKLLAKGANVAIGGNWLATLAGQGNGSDCGTN